MPTLSKPALYNETIVRMPNKTHKRIFLDTTLRKGTSYNSIKTTQSLVKKKKTTKNNKPPTKKPNQPVLNQAALQQNMEQ